MYTSIAHNGFRVRYGAHLKTVSLKFAQLPNRISNDEFITVSLIFANTMLNRCSKAFKEQQMHIVVTPVKQTTDWKMIAKEKLHFELDQCPCCKKGKMQELLSFDNNGPPKWLLRKLQGQDKRLQKLA